MRSPEAFMPRRGCSAARCTVLSANTGSTAIVSGHHVDIETLFPNHGDLPMHARLLYRRDGRHIILSIVARTTSSAGAYGLSVDFALGFATEYAMPIKKMLASLGSTMHASNYRADMRKSSSGRCHRR